MNVFTRELYVALHGQSARFRAIKYAALIPCFAYVYWRFGGEVFFKTLGVLLVLSLIVHFFYRWKTDGWTKDWGGYTSVFDSR